ncbi:hypothetical protein ETAA8_36670 [Anatilimnocola aggregata]|uniref:Cytochrome c-552/4 domain-containing protein n=1 Tax=Anatilimnocola aggregata TaxID=2528021 RepID=A0A517YEB7_9BACT|nr:multiheme c-type cytochrome [Anatilimnocola aggregata]QDU28564.1 hypothetical protein ETAA8_36670 [Anatilimnocola aggregata]
MQLSPCYNVVSLLAFLAALSGCQEAVAPLSAVDSRLASDVTNEAVVRPSSPPNSPHQFVGRISCSATACHGATDLTKASWHNAYQLWSATDPHRRAFDVLYAERSVQMYRKLKQDQAEHINEPVYLKFLEETCIGCHATPIAGSLANTSFTFQNSPAAYWQGVSCESCHGAASDWIEPHDAKAWPESGQPERARVAQHTGFQDLRSLNDRGAACVKCHVGPQSMGTRLYDVNHDLIAAGHPRLTFELHAYLDNLPKHWDEAAEQARHDKQIATSPSSFHFDTWLAGQRQQRQQLAALKQARTETNAALPAGPWAEFANRDCRECHHPIGEPTFRLTTLLKPAPTTTLLDRINSPTTVQQRAEVIARLISDNRSAPGSNVLPTCDAAVQIYLAAKAFAADLPAGDDSTRLNAALTQLQHILAQHAGATQYDFPGKFDPRQTELQQAFTALEATLLQLSR